MALGDTSANIYEAVQTALEAVIEDTYNTVVDENASTPYIAHKISEEPVFMKSGRYMAAELIVFVVADTNAEILGYIPQIIAAIEGMESTVYQYLTIINVKTGKATPDFSEEDNKWFADIIFEIEYE